jgi:hypothetical protein
MNVHTESQVVVACDVGRRNCQGQYVEAGVRRSFAMLMARHWGWTIRRNGEVVCPSCRKEESSEEADASGMPPSPLSSFWASRSFDQLVAEQAVYPIGDVEQTDAGVGWPWGLLAHRRTTGEHRLCEPTDG